MRSPRRLREGPPTNKAFRLQCNWCDGDCEVAALLAPYLNLSASDSDEAEQLISKELCEEGFCYLPPALKLARSHVRLGKAERQLLLAAPWEEDGDAHEKYFINNGRLTPSQAQVVRRAADRLEDLLLL